MNHSFLQDVVHIEDTDSYHDHQDHYEKATEPIVLRGRTFSQQDVDKIRSITATYYAGGRTAISEAVCKELNWRQPNGWLKDRACRHVLVSLERLGMLELPPRKTKGLPYSNNRKPESQSISESYQDTSSDCLGEMPKEITLLLSKGDSLELEWNRLVDAYHYLGHKVVVGRCLKYLIKGDDRILGAISFSSAVWQIAARDSLLANIMDIKQIRDCVINNSRFLILPGVSVKNLASRLLSLASRQVVSDWSRYYSITPQIAETFVEPERFHGTCYKAANWIEIGSTKGYAKKGSVYQNRNQPKQVFVYGLNTAMRRRIQHLIEEKRIPHEYEGHSTPASG